MISGRTLRLILAIPLCILILLPFLVASWFQKKHG